jgi:uncharacterized protein YndB with AHSA1/START domain
MSTSNQVSSVVGASADSVFRTLTDIDQLPTWNETMTRVVDRPRTLEPGAEWVVEFHVLGRTWNSRSTLDELDTTSRRFAYRSRTDDGNPSEASWRWEVAEDPAGSRVTVTWSLRPVTFWRRVLLGRIRNRQLARSEVPASLQALTAAALAANAAG